jgi:hypothetical protein
MMALPFHVRTFWGMTPTLARVLRFYYRKHLSKHY